MNEAVRSQLGQFLLAVSLGCGLAVLWALHSAVSGVLPRLRAVLDVLFGLLLLPVNLLFALYVGGGRFRLYYFPAIALGWALFAAYPGKLLPGLLAAGFHGIGRLIRFLL